MKKQKPLKRNEKQKYSREAEFRVERSLGGVCFFSFLLKAICFQNLIYLFFYFFHDLL